ncbi:MAG TPA: trimethylamine methyltransferase family protein, partial [Bacillota bacterium]|nr:trimethylamine methyltransferase family protein [Bacillota bacterium]
ASVVMAQLIKPGVGVIIEHGIKPMDMQTGHPYFTDVSKSLTTAITNQLLRRYKIPSKSTSGFTSISKKIDFQCGYEKSMGALISALSGGHIQIFQGGSASELVYNTVLAIMDDDVAGWIGRFLEGVTVNDETLAVDVINEVGPIPGHFLNTAHTRKWWKAEHYATRVADREVYPVWVKSGKKDALDHARERMREILATHKPEPLSDSQERAIRNILDEARNYYREKGLISDQEWAVYMETLDSAD